MKYHTQPFFKSIIAPTSTSHYICAPRMHGLSSQIETSSLKLKDVCRVWPNIWIGLSQCMVQPNRVVYFRLSLQPCVFFFIKKLLVSILVKSVDKINISTTNNASHPPVMLFMRVDEQNLLDFILKPIDMKLSNRYISCTPKIETTDVITNTHYLLFTH